MKNRATGRWRMALRGPVTKSTRKARPAWLVLLTLPAVLAVLLLLAPEAFAASSVNGWKTDSISVRAASYAHARLCNGRLVWMETGADGKTSIALLDVGTEERRTVTAQGVEPEIDGDHLAYVNPAGPIASGRAGREVVLYTISTGEERRLTADAQARFNYGVAIHGDVVTWLSATRMGIEGPPPGDVSLMMHTISTGETVTLAAGKEGVGGPTRYAAGPEWVAWNEEPAYGDSDDLELWTYSVVTGETREPKALAGARVLGLSGDVAVLSLSPRAEAGTEQLWSYNLRSGEWRLIDEVASGHQSVQVDGNRVGWAAYGDGSAYMAIYDLPTGALSRVRTPGYDVGGLVLRGDVAVWHGQFRGRSAGTTWNYLFAYDCSRQSMTRLGTLFGDNDDYDTDGERIAFSTGNWWPYDWGRPTELLVASPVASPPDVFLDVSGTDPYRTAVQGLKERSIVEGYGTVGGSEYRAGSPLTRAQFAKMLALALDLPIDPSVEAPFDDVPPGLFPGAYVAALAQHGIASGTGDRRFSPYQNVTRAQLMTLLVRGVDRMEPGVLGTPPATTWPDYRGALGPFDPTHGPYLLRAEANGLVDGLLDYGKAWDPWRPATRAEAAQAVWNVLAKEGRPAPTITTVDTADNH